ncbi:HAD family hydrolase [Allofranklinella schreckenbergeri]|uniref:HAD family hydrolase n=1 Tax=Allofranklinella schreckenbergeri TaxID=1076744 RepID=A0A3M6PYS3_9BURK|nr:HAD-IA family hydrolase [Allofranklinella schreckenbergeri]RMW96189.1 HAD family hydrolase [Allofranklinella schreckenbergeri]RMX06283.1 HAD family hydrolase [Allofranklinella schreckenbergeri]
MSHSHQFKMLAFDWDGTLFDSTALIALSIQDAVRDLGEDPPTLEEARWVIGMELNSALAKVAPNLSPKAYADLANRYRYHYLRRQEDIVFFDGVIPMLQGLKERGFLLAVATGKSRRGLDHLLKCHDLQDLFHDSRTADETAGKPNPLMLEELMQVWDVLPNQLLMIGDTSHDLQMAYNANSPSLAVTYGAHAEQELRAWNPLAVLDSIADVDMWLSSQAGRVE